MIQTEKATFLREVEEIVRSFVVCDVCGKKAPIFNRFSGEVYQRYYSVTIWHSDWGNDSCDSYDEKQACSYQCALKLAENWFEENSDSETAHCDIEAHTRMYKE